MTINLFESLACTKAGCRCATSARENKGNTHCPAHEDDGPSLTVTTKDEKLLFHCKAGCSQEDVIAALRVRGLWSRRATKARAPAGKTVFRLRDATGELVADHHRIDYTDGRAKTIWWERKGRKGLGGLPVQDLPLYGADELRKVGADSAVVLVEGERAQTELKTHGVVAVATVCGAATTPSIAALAPLLGHDVSLWADNDPPGRAHMLRIAERLREMGQSAKWIEWKDAPVGGDAVDFFCSNGTTDGLRELIAASQTADALTEEGTAERSRPSWPDPLQPRALHGLAGDFVKLVAPHTEADPVALLLQFLVGFGSLIGRGPHFRAEADLHYTNNFVVLVGETAKGRKGSSWGQVRARLAFVDQPWSTERIQSGLSSGEGLIWAVRDKVYGREPMKEKGRITGYQEVELDPGVSDKRLLIVQTEFASVTAVMERDGNTLSAIIRQAWDDGDLRVLTKNSPAKASDAHISLIGHITASELRRTVTRTELGNGFANRITWAVVRRSNVLPDGGALDQVDFGPFLRRLGEAVDFARHLGKFEVQRDAGARELWHQVYEELSEGKPGLLGAIISRAEAHVMRFAVIYAVLDRSSVICRSHLEAALALWRYCEDSARYIWGESLGDPVADELLTALRAIGATGMTRTEISHLFARHREAGEIDRAISALAGRGLIRSKKQRTAGRTAERWYALANTAKAPETIVPDAPLVESETAVSEGGRTDSRRKRTKRKNVEVGTDTGGADPHCRRCARNRPCPRHENRY